MSKLTNILIILNKVGKGVYKRTTEHPINQLLMKTLRVEMFDQRFSKPNCVFRHSKSQEIKDILITLHIYMDILIAGITIVIWLVSQRNQNGLGSEVSTPCDSLYMYPKG